jgi:hypothetical protein
VRDARIGADAAHRLLVRLAGDRGSAEDRQNGPEAVRDGVLDLLHQRVDVSVGPPANRQALGGQVHLHTLRWTPNRLPTAQRRYERLYTSQAVMPPVVHRVVVGEATHRAATSSPWRLVGAAECMGSVGGLATVRLPGGRARVPPKTPRTDVPA